MFEVNAIAMFEQHYHKMLDLKQWYSAIRQQAWSVFEKNGIPTLRDENWKYTGIAPLFAKPLNFVTQPHNLPAEKTADEYVLVFLDGILLLESSILPAEEELEIISLSKISRDKEMPTIEGVLLSDWLEAKISQEYTMAALATALSPECYFLNVKKSLSKPLRMRHYHSGVQAACSFSHQMLYLSPKTQVVCVEEFYTQEAGESILNSRFDIVMGDDAKLEHTRIQLQSDASTHIRCIQVKQASGSELSSFAFDLGGKLVRTDLYTDLVGEYAQCRLVGLYLANEKSHVDNHTRIDHRAPNGVSEQYYKGIIGDRARAVFNGKVLVYPDAQNTNAAQKNKNLLLSSQAEIDTKPELEIYADEVKCAHGATVGQLDEEALFYLQARGLSRDEAQSLLLYAFGEEMIARVPDKTLLSTIRDAFIAKLSQGCVVKEYL